MTGDAHSEDDLHRYYPLTVQRVVRETVDTSSFVFAIPPDLTELFRYRAGQFLTFRAEVGAQILTRCYSLASAPETDPEHKVTVKRVAGGRMSNWFNDQVRGGDPIEVMPPAGHFVLKDHDRPILLFGGGSGVTPVISIVKSAIETTDRPIRLVYANRDAASVIFQDELDVLVSCHRERFRVHHHLDSDSGLLTAEAVAGQLDGFEDADIYICGPGPFMDLVERVLAERETPKDHIHIERFVSPPDSPERERRFHPLEVTRVTDDGTGARALTLAVPAGLASELAHQPGQHITIRAQVGGVPLVRCYSLTNAPGDPLEISVRRLSEGRVSAWLADEVHEGSQLEVAPPSGRFTLRPSPRRLMLVAAGIGITPIVSIAESALAAGDRAVRLFYATRDATSSVQDARLARLEQTHGARFEVIRHRDDADGPPSPAVLRRAVMSFVDSDFYVSGPGGFMDLTERLLAALGVSRERVLFERFASPPDPRPEEPAAPLGDVPSRITVVLRGGRHEVEVPTGKSVLEAVRAAGLKPPFACEDGYCGCCMARLVSGRVAMRHHDALTAAEVADGWVLTCQAHAQTEACEIDYDQA